MSANSLFVEPSQMARRRLRIARQAVRSAGRTALTAVSDADHVAVVVQLDFAIETLLRAILFESEHPRPRIEVFRDLLNAARELLKEKGILEDVPGRGGLEQLRSVRNAAQHEARVPTPVEIAECSVHARDALVEIARVAWNVDFFTADIDAVRSQRVAEYLRRAVDARASGDNYGAKG